jgi:hypothetical protein
MSGMRVFVTLPEPGMRPADVGLGDARLVETNYSTWELAAGLDSLAEVFDLVSRRRLTSAYVSTDAMPRDKPWVAREWQGKVVTDLRLADEIRRRFVDWVSNLLVEHRLVIFEPPYAEPRKATRTDYRDHLDDQAPLFVEADLDDVRANPKEWFGEYAGPGAAGWVTLLSAAMVNGGSRRILLGNLAALGLRKNDGAGSLWTAVRSGFVSAKAIGFSRGQEDWHEMAGFRLPRAKFTFDVFESSNAGYAVAVEIGATVDPKVIIGSGTVFEQFSPDHVQNLSVAQEWHDTIDADQILGVVLPAYCLNQNMSPPSGQLLQLTPLAFAGNSGDQHAVWRDIAERRHWGRRL